MYFRDPVCEIDVDEQEAASKGLVSEFRGQKYYFESPGCKQSFDAEPERYAGKQWSERWIGESPPPPADQISELPGQQTEQKPKP